MNFYGTQAWRRLAAECIARQPVCATPGCGEASRHADHITPRAQGGADALGNLRALCIRCHGTRFGGREPKAKGCDAAGNPRDPGHWWRS